MSAARQAQGPTRAFTRVAKEDWAAVKDYYRLIDQPDEYEVTPSHILPPTRSGRYSTCGRSGRCCASRTART